MTPRSTSACTRRKPFPAGRFRRNTRHAAVAREEQGDGDGDGDEERLLGPLRPDQPGAEQDADGEHQPPDEQPGQQGALVGQGAAADPAAIRHGLLQDSAECTGDVAEDRKAGLSLQSIWHGTSTSPAAATAPSTPGSPPIRPGGSRPTTRAGARAYTRSRRPVRLIHVEPAADRGAALRRELAIKRLARPGEGALVTRSIPHPARRRRSSAASGRRRWPFLRRLARHNSREWFERHRAGLRDRGARPAPEPGRGDGRPAGARRSRAGRRPAPLGVPHPPGRPLLGRQVAVQDQRRLPVLPPRRGPGRRAGRRGRGRRALLPAGRRGVLRGGRHLDAGAARARQDPRGAGGGPRGARPDRPGPGLPPPVQGARPRGDADPAPAGLRRRPPGRAVAPVQVVHRHPDCSPSARRRAPGCRRCSSATSRRSCRWCGGSTAPSGTGRGSGGTSASRAGLRPQRPARSRASRMRTARFSGEKGFCRKGYGELRTAGWSLSPSV